MEDDQNPQEPQQEEEKKKSGPSTRIINRANDFRNKIKSKNGLSDGKKAIDAVSDPSSIVKSKIPGLGGKGGPKEIRNIAKQTKNIRRIIQVAAKIPLPVWIGIGIALLIILLFFFIVTLIGALSGGENGGEFSGVTPLPTEGEGGFSKVSGFVLSLDCPEEQPVNGAPATCIISYTYDPAIANIPLENIIIHFELPENTAYTSATPIPTTQDSITYSWPLSNPVNQASIQVLFTNTVPDSIVDAFAYISFVDAGPGGGPSGSGTACTGPYEGTGPCSVSELSKVFTGDSSRAIAASMICQKESGSSPLSKNITSGTGCNMDGENNDDYSIGLFQINLIWHVCSVAGHGYANTPSSERCQNLVSESNRSSCEGLLEDRNQNIQKAFEISSGGTDWSAWSTWGDHPEWGYTGVRTRLANCGITVQ